MSEKLDSNQVALATDRKKNIFASREERVKLLRRGLFGAQIENIYNDVNSIFVLKTDWQDGHETGPFFSQITPTYTLCRHVSSPASGPCAVDLREVR